jgi:hypothetical protein
MRRMHRVVMLAVLIGLGPAIAGCTDFDPDKLDVLGLTEKKKLPGERKPLFPEGVPGVTQGIPPEYLKGNVAEQTGAAVPIEPLKAEQPPAAQTASAEPAAAAEKPKPRKRVAAKPKPTRVTIAPPAQPAAAPPAQAASPWPSAPPPSAQQPQQPAAQQAASPWPDPQPQAAPAPWPSAPPPGTFSKQ